jgi:hypothetical protein
MASFQKFYSFVEALGNSQHNLSTDVLKIALADVQPTPTLTQFSQISEITAGGGYTAGGVIVSNGFSQTTGVATMAATDHVFTATVGGIAPFQWVVLYNDTSASDLLIGWWDAGTTINLSTANSTFTVTFTTSELFTLQ